MNATNIAVFCLESSYLASKKLLLKILNLELIFFYTQKTKYNYRSLFLLCIHHSYLLKCISELSFILVSAFLEILPRTGLKLRKYFGENLPHLKHICNFLNDGRIALKRNSTIRSSDGRIAPVLYFRPTDE